MTWARALALASVVLVACNDEGPRPDGGGSDLAKDFASLDQPSKELSTADRPATDFKPGERKPTEATVVQKDVGWFFPDGNPTNKAVCFGQVYACSNGIDDDGDKLIDSSDLECTGPCDNDEGSFGLNIPGVNMAVCKQDCYWDKNSGSGADSCEWSLKCDPKSPGAKLAPPCPYDANYSPCLWTQSAECTKNCLPLTPNGCDCFGCCEVWTAAGKYPDTVWLGTGPTCTAKTPQNCAACTQVTGCKVACGECELCLGKSISQLPAKCFQPQPKDLGLPDGWKPPWDGWKPPDSGIGVPWQCPLNSLPCLTSANCPASQYCITGCCKLALQ